eukprot:TRINITY_DN11808_c0_g1_i5.p1 TRINITY_DN11808_c0_g1~~TRINITY_DN11808_c0_g1_i5.p1  ORF type:complete len:651 (+),score=198.04 TRINITY_DN11808_c0_g1_i5:153-2105(+)
MYLPQQVVFSPAMLQQMQQFRVGQCVPMQQLQQPQQQMQMAQQMQSSQHDMQQPQQQMAQQMQMAQQPPQQLQQQPQHEMHPQQIPAPPQQMQAQIQIQTQEHMHRQVQPQQDMQVPQQTSQPMQGQHMQLQQQVQQMNGAMQQMQFMHAMQTAQLQQFQQNQLMQQTAQVHGQQERMHQQGSPDMESLQDHVQQQQRLQQQQTSPSFLDHHGHMQQTSAVESDLMQQQHQQQQQQQQRFQQQCDQQRLEDSQKQRHHSEQQSSPAKPFQEMRRVNNKPLGQRPRGSATVGLPKEQQMSTSRFPSSSSGLHAGTAVPVGPILGSVAASPSAASSSGKAERKRNKRGTKEPQRSLSTESPQDQEALEYLKWQLEMGRSAEAVATIRGHVLSMTLESEGSCRIVQLALKSLSPHDAAELAKELKGNVCQAALSIHGNHVLQRIIELLPATRWEFLVMEIAENCLEIAKNVYGCRIFCRLTEQAINSHDWQALVENLLQEADSLARHQYGRFVAQSLLEYGTEEQKHRLAMAVLANLSALAQNRNASHVVDKALVYCSNADREQLAMRLLYDNRGEGEQAGLFPLVKTQFGGYVVKALVAMSGNIAAEARRQLALIAAKRFKDKTGSKDFRMAERLLSELQITPVEAEPYHAA